MGAFCSFLVSILLVPLFLFFSLPALASQYVPPIQRSVLSNKLVVLLSEDHSLPFVTIKLLVDAGSARDPVKEEGLARLTAKGILMGTQKRSAAQISYELDFMGASLAASVDKDYAFFNLRVLKKDLNKGFDLLLDGLTRPVFPEDEVEHEIEKTLSALRSEEERPGKVANDEFEKALFLNNPYSHQVEGTRESLRNLKRDKLMEFHKTYYGPNNAILAITGDITSEEVKTGIVPLMEQWRICETPKTAQDGPYARGPRTIKINRTIAQANIIIGNKGISRTNPDFYAATVMNYILGGGGFSSRLMQDIRNRRGFAYDVSSEFDAAKHPGAFQVTLQTKNASAREAVDLTLKEMKRIQRELVSEKELEGAERYLIGSFPKRLDGQSKLAQFLLLVEFYGLGLDYIEKYPGLIRSVTREDVLRVARTYLDPDSPIIVVVGDLKEAGME